MNARPPVAQDVASSSANRISRVKWHRYRHRSAARRAAPAGRQVKRSDKGFKHARQPNGDRERAAALLSADGVHHAKVRVTRLVDAESTRWRRRTCAEKRCHVTFHRHLTVPAGRERVNSVRMTGVGSLAAGQRDLQPSVAVGSAGRWCSTWAPSRGISAVATPDLARNIVRAADRSRTFRYFTLSSRSSSCPQSTSRRRERTAAAAHGLSLDPKFRQLQSADSPEYHGVMVTYAQVASHPTLHRVRTEARRVGGSTRSTTAATPHLGRRHPGSFR